MPLRASTADSLLTLLETCEEDSICLRLKLEVCDEYLFSEPALAEEYATEAMSQAKLMHDTLALARSHNYKGILATIQAHYLTGIEQFQSALAYFEQLDDVEGMTKLLNNIGVIYSMMEDYEASIKHYSDCLEINIEVGDHEGAAFNLYNIAGDYLALEKYDLSKQYIDSLIQYQDVSGEHISAEPLLGEFFLARGDLASAEMYLLNAQKSHRRENEEHQLTSGWLSLAQLYTQKERYDLALVYLDSSETTSISNNLNEELVATHQQRAEVYDAIGSFKKAFESQNLYIALKDSLEEINKFNRISELNARFESDKREKEIAEAEAMIIQSNAQKSAQKRIFLVITAFIALILCLVSYALIRNKKINRVLNSQNLEIEEQRSKIISSITYAQKIQNAMLLPEEEFQKFLPDAFIYFRPKDIVSGDFYWFDEFDGKLMIATIDCTGHGVPGAFMSLIANSKLNKVVHEMGIRNPGDILNKVHEEILKSLNQHSHNGNTQDGMDMSLCIIDQKNREIGYAGARTPILLIKDGEVSEVKPDGLSIGGSFFRDKLIGTKGFNTQVINYEQGTYLYMFTDGYIDQFGGEANKKLNKSRFHQLISSLSINGLNKAKEQLDIRLSEWRGSNEQIDDILIIGTKLS